VRNQQLAGQIITYTAPVSLARVALLAPTGLEIADTEWSANDRGKSCTTETTTTSGVATIYTFRIVAATVWHLTPLPLALARCQLTTPPVLKHR
jgi:hypothetical protein